MVTQGKFLYKLHIWRRTNKKVMLSRSRLGNVGIALFLTLVCVFMILPIFYAIVQAFKPIDEIFAYPPRFFVKNPTLDNFHQVIKLADNLWVPFSRYVFNSLFVTVLGTGLYVVIASLAAYPLAKAKFWGSALISQLIVWTLLFRPEVTAVPTYIVISKLGILNTYMAVIAPTLAGTMGVFLMRQFMISSIPDATLEAARIDGANEYIIFGRIVMPSVRPALFTLIIFTFQALWNGASSQHYIYSENLKQLPSVLSTIAAGGIARAGAGSAVSVLLMIPPIAIFIYSQRSVMETMTYSGLK